MSFASWKDSISHPIYQFERVIAAAGLCVPTAARVRVAATEKSKVQRKTVSRANSETCPSQKIKSHVQSGHVEGLPWNTCHPPCLAIPHSIFETRRKLTRHELLARQPHGNHAQVIHSRGPGCGIGDGHVELGSV